jgi:hypothetical protein
MNTGVPVVAARNRAFALSITLLFAVSLALSSPASAQNGLAKISVDNLTNTDSDHKTEVEPDSCLRGANTIVSAFHMWPGGRDRLAGAAVMLALRLLQTAALTWKCMAIFPA